VSAALLSEEHRDALQEVANIGMGQAGNSVAQLLKEFVELSVPRIQVLSREDLGRAIGRAVGDTEVTAIRQAFHGGLRGETIAVFNSPGFVALAESMGYEDELSTDAQQELLLDISNLLIGACLGEISRLLSVNVAFSPPALVGERLPASDIVRAADVHLDWALYMNVNFKMEKHSFGCDLVILVPEREVGVLTEAVTRFVESI
jgi:chemotaxis protein CheC